MKLIYKGKYNGDENSLPHGEHMPGAVRFKEADNMTDFAKRINGLALLLSIVCFAIVGVRIAMADVPFSLFSLIGGYLLSMLAVFPHEIIHGLCFREEVELYTNWKQGMLFVTGSEHFTKTRFILMSLMPNLVFGFVPFLLFLVNPQLDLLGMMGAYAIGMGAGDYYNVYNALTQVPKNGMVYNVGFHSYWYVPEK